MKNTDFLAYIKYEGESLSEGVIDLRSSSKALEGLNDALLYFVKLKNSQIDIENLNIPINIKKGSWEVSIPSDLSTYVNLMGVIMGGPMLLRYGQTFGEKAAAEGILETGPAKDVKKLVKSAFVLMKAVVGIYNHLMGNKNVSQKNVKINNDQNVPKVVLINNEGSVLEVKKEEFDVYLKCPKDLFENLVLPVSADRTLEIGVNDGSKPEKIDSISKAYFCSLEDNNEVVLPELKDGEYVALVGEVTRVTETANTIGFRYKEHILVCRPVNNNNVAKFKNSLISMDDTHIFPKVKLEGIVDRTSKNGEFKEKKPQIVFSNIEPIDDDIYQQVLF